MNEMVLNPYFAAEWSSPVARRAHNPKVVSSNLASAMITPLEYKVLGEFFS